MFKNVSMMILSVLFLLVTVVNGAETNKGDIAVLFTGYRHADCGYAAAQTLHKNGFNIRATHNPGLLKHRLTLEELKQYNVVVLTGLGRAAADYSLTELNKDNISALLQYAKAGGGIIYMPSWVQDDLSPAPQHAFAKKIGMDLLFEEVPFDPENSVRATAWEIPFALTDNIFDSPVTKDVNALWYPVATRVGAGIHTMLFKPDEDWTTVIRGKKTAFSKHFPMDDGHIEVKNGGPGAFTNEFPLVSIRSYGKGRLAVFPIESRYLYGKNAATTLENILPERGLRNVPSDGWKLFENLLRWTAEPSAQIDTIGGAAMESSLFINPDKITYNKPWNWDKQAQRMPDLPYLRGVIGARTSYTTGKATAAEWVAKAKSMGLQYLVFLEKFSELTAEELAALKKECRALSDENFLAVPGYTIDDEIGNHYFFFATTVPYPDKKFLSDNGKVFVSRDAALNRENPRAIKGQLAMTLLNFALEKHIQVGNYRFSQDASPFPNWFSNWDASGIITCLNGKMIDDSTKVYLAQADLGQGPNPYVIDLMDEPAMLKVTPWRTVLRMPLEKLEKYFNSRHFYPNNPTSLYVTGGPTIDEWRFIGPRDYVGANQGDFVWQDLRWKVVGKASSDVGIAEVVVMDGKEIFRRFLPGGKKQFSFELDLTHNQQHDLVMIVTDKNGKRAISHEQWDRNIRLEEFNCSDRNNQFTYGITSGRDGERIMVGGNQALSTPDKRVDGREVSPAGTFKNDHRLGAPAFDGSANGEPAFIAPLTLKLQDGNISAPRACEAFRLLHTGDVNIGEARNEYRFMDDIHVANVWHTLWRVEPSDDFVTRSRRYFFQIDPASPLAVFRWDIEITLKRDLPNEGMDIAFIRSGKERLWTIRSSDGLVISGLRDKEDRSAGRNIDVPVEPGGYAALLDSPLGGCAVFPLSSGMRVKTWLPNKSNISFFMPAENMLHKAGESTTFSFLMLGIPRATEITEMLSAPSTEVVERFRSDYGIDGSAPAYQADLKSGQIIKASYPLVLDGTADRSVSGTITGDLVSSLPIEVSGMNDRWSALLYDRKLKKARPIGVFEGIAWATVVIDKNQLCDLFIGHPVICDNEQMFIQFTQSAADEWTLQINNPQDTPVTVRLRPNPDFDPLLKKGWQGETITIPAGTMVTRIL